MHVLTGARSSAWGSLEEYGLLYLTSMGELVLNCKSIYLILNDRRIAS